jgi:hypothetical protein
VGVVSTWTGARYTLQIHHKHCHVQKYGGQFESKRNVLFEIMMILIMALMWNSMASIGLIICGKIIPELIRLVHE